MNNKLYYNLSYLKSVLFKKVANQRKIQAKKQKINIKLVNINFALPLFCDKMLIWKNLNLKFQTLV